MAANERVARGHEGAANVEAFKKRVGESLAPGELEQYQEIIRTFFTNVLRSSGPRIAGHPVQPTEDEVNVVIVDSADLFIEKITRDGPDVLRAKSSVMQNPKPSYDTKTSDDAIAHFEKRVYATITLAETLRH